VTAKSCVMNLAFARIEHVTESVVEPLNPLAAEELPVGESFEALCRRTFPRVYGYVASLPTALLAGAAILRRRRREAALL
jgi:hypothetical protein